MKLIASSSVTCPSWCTNDRVHGEGADRMLWHEALLGEYDGVTVHLGKPRGQPSTGSIEPPRLRLTIHDEVVSLPETFGTWTLLDLMWALTEAAHRLEVLLDEAPVNDRDLLSLA